MTMNPLRGTLLPALLLLIITGCKKEIRDEAAAPDVSSAVAKEKTTDSELLKSVKQATSRFHSTVQAVNAGYVPDDHCVSVPGRGGMGYHWANPSLIDPVYDPLKPEAVLYASGPEGKLRIVALEYIVINVGQPRPMFGSRPFDIGGTPVQAPHWSLHVWLYQDNPNGMFTPFNPTVTCP